MNAAARFLPQTTEARRRSRRHFAPPRRMRLVEWSERYRRLASGPIKGAFRVANQPALRGIMEACDDPAVRELWCIKSSQFGWTQGIVLNVVLRSVHLMGIITMILFPKDGAGKRFSRSKLLPAIQATPEVEERVNLAIQSGKRSWDFLATPNGSVQLAGTNVAANIKSEDAELVIVEEPNDTKRNVQDQGEVITLGRERLKATNGILLVGGTPTLTGFCKMESGMETTDKRRFYVACPNCGHRQTMRFEQIQWLKGEIAHPVYGKHLPETARYQCEAEGCPTLWSQAELHRAIRIAGAAAPNYGWHSTAPFTGRAGFYVSDLLSVMVGARMSDQVKKFLEAHNDLKKGDDRAMIAFVNNQKGETYRIKSDVPEVELLRDRGLPYDEWTVPEGGLIVTGFVDVQRGGEQSGEPRLELLLRAFGRGMESWLGAREVILGNPLEWATWEALDRHLERRLRSLGGFDIPISALGVDSGDGVTSEAVYRYCRHRRSIAGGPIVMATKGSSDYKRDIYSPPKQTADSDALGRAAKWGIKVYQIGTEAAKDLLLGVGEGGRIKLKGTGPGRIHWYAAAGDDYLQQFTASEAKVPGKSGRRVWTKKTGARNEALDCEVGVLHAAHRLRLHTMTDRDWMDVESSLRQRTLFNMVEPKPQVPRGTSDVPPPRRGTPAPDPFGSDAWGSRI